MNLGVALVCTELLEGVCVNFTESAISSKIRNGLSGSDFGIPALKKYPLIDAQHVRLAIRFFNSCPEDKRELLAENIIKAMDKFKLIDSINIDLSTEFGEFFKDKDKYLTESSNEYQVSENVVAQMLPQVPVQGPIITKRISNVSLYDETISPGEFMPPEEDIAVDPSKVTSLDDDILKSEDPFMESKISLGVIKKNREFDLESLKVVKKLLKYLNDSDKNSDAILKSSLNFKGNIRTFKLTSDPQSKNNPTIKAIIKGAGYTSLNEDDTLSSVYEKHGNGISITLTYDEVMDKIKLQFSEDSDTITESSKDDIDDDIKGLIEKLNRKGYKTKYSCSGHGGSRSKKDVYRDGVYMVNYILLLE